MLGTKSRYRQIWKLTGRKLDSDFVRTKLEYYCFHVKTSPEKLIRNSKTARIDSEGGVEGVEYYDMFSLLESVNILTDNEISTKNEIFSLTLTLMLIN